MPSLKELPVRASRFLLCGVLALLIAFASRADAATLTFSANGVNGATGSSLAAEVVFTYDGAEKLLVELKNTSGQGALAQSDVLTALFFDLPNKVTLTPVNAFLTGGSVLLNPPMTPQFGKEWAFNTGIVGPKGTDSGISAAGFGLFGKGNFSPPGNNVGGSDYGVVSFISPYGNKPTQTGTYAQDSMSFLFAVGGSFNLNDLNSVIFQYGSSLSDPKLMGASVPEPGTVTLFASVGLMGVACLRRKGLVKRGGK